MGNELRAAVANLKLMTGRTEIGPLKDKAPALVNLLTQFY